MSNGELVEAQNGEVEGASPIDSHLSAGSISKETLPNTFIGTPNTPGRMPGLVGPPMPPEGEHMCFHVKTCFLMFLHVLMS